MLLKNQKIIRQVAEMYDANMNIHSRKPNVRDIEIDTPGELHHWQSKGL